MEYNAEYFIRKFKQIPEELYCKLYEEGERRCYFGHCNSEEAAALYKLLRTHLNTSAGYILNTKKAPFCGKTLKKRILYALKQIKNGHYYDFPKRY